MTKIHRGFLADCEKEKLQYSGAIQGYGALLILTADLEVTHFSENFSEMVGLDPSELGESVKQGKQLPALVTIEEQPGARLQIDEAFESPVGTFDLVVTRGSKSELVVEFFLSNIVCPEWQEPPDMLHVHNLKDVEVLREELVAWISRVSGFDRVMYYQFLDQGDGEVIAEVCQDSAQGSYLGLRFPASDIPQIARQIYLKNPWRVIYDAMASSVPICGNTTVDLTCSDLRSVSPVHSVYMQNMGNRSSLSLPISAGAELDALISCHSHKPYRLPLKRLTVIQDVVKHFNRVVRNVVTTNRVRLVDEMGYNTRHILQSLGALSNIESQWQVFSSWLLEEFEADAVVWCRNNDIFCAGIGVDRVLIEQIDNWFTYHCDELVFFEERIRPMLSDDLLTNIAGAAGLRVRLDANNSRLFLFRTEQVEEVLWGGNPNKPVDYHDGVFGIAPRRSFGKWVEKRMGFSRAWGNATRLRLLKLRDGMQRYPSKLLGSDELQGQLDE